MEKEVRLKQGALSDYTMNRTPNKYMKYKQQRNRATSKMRKARQSYKGSIAYNVKKAPKELYSYIHSGE